MLLTAASGRTQRARNFPRPFFPFFKYWWRRFRVGSCFCRVWVARCDTVGMEISPTISSLFCRFLWQKHVFYCQKKKHSRRWNRVKFLYCPWKKKQQGSSGCFHSRIVVLWPGRSRPPTFFPRVGHSDDVESGVSRGESWQRLLILGKGSFTFQTSMTVCFYL